MTDDKIRMTLLKGLSDLAKNNCVQLAATVLYCNESLDDLCILEIKRHKTLDTTLSMREDTATMMQHANKDAYTSRFKFAGHCQNCGKYGGDKHSSQRRDNGGNGGRGKGNHNQHSNNNNQGNLRSNPPRYPKKNPNPNSNNRPP